MATSPEVVTDTNKNGTFCRVVTVITLFVALAVFNLDFNVDFPGAIRTFHEEWTNPNLPSSVSRASPAHPESDSSKVTKVRGEILDKLRELSRLASDGGDYTLKAAQRKSWHRQNPCQSRSELPAMYAKRKHVKDIERNPLWEEVLEEYSNLHRICMKRAGNITVLFLNKANVTIPGCKFLVGEGTNGLGNKILVTVSTVLYAIATQRILLIPQRTNLKHLLCEPFVGSSWMLETDALVPPSSNTEISWEEEKVFFLNMEDRWPKEEESENHTQTGSSTSPSPLVDAIVVSSGWGQWAPKEWFYCRTEQKFLSAVPWVYMSGCLYSAAKIFGSPAFRPTLTELFPDNMVLTRLFRSTLLPGDRVWSRFRHLNHAYFRQPDRRVSVQLRFYKDAHDAMSAMVNDRIMDCVLKNDILPNVIDSIAEASANTTEMATTSSPPPPTVTALFIASLYSDLRDRFTEFYLRNPTDSGEDVDVVQLTNRWHQSTGVEEDTEALVEVLFLSVSDVLLVTPWSTFGGLAHGYGGLTPWLINTINSSSTESCERAQSVDNCQVNSGVGYSCSMDPPPAPPDWNHDEGAQQETPILGPCYIFGSPAGVQVLTGNFSK